LPRRYLAAHDAAPDLVGKTRVYLAGHVARVRENNSFVHGNPWIAQPKNMPCAQEGVQEPDALPIW
jgi:hypothetical protein